MDEIDEALGNKTENDSKPASGEGSGEVSTVKINGREYTPEKFAEMAKDYENLTKHEAQLSGELGRLKEEANKIPSETPNTEKLDLTDEQKKQAKELFKKEFGLVDKEELDRREYAKEASSEMQKIAKKYGIKEEELGKELVDFSKAAGKALPVDRFESYWKTNHPEEFDKWRKENIDKDRPSIPYTMQPNRGTADLGSETRAQFGRNVVDKALELIGAK